jgi:hypothetical protein
MPARIPENVKIAIAAALAQGKPKTHIALEFKVSRPTIDKIEALGKSVQNPANPLAGDWREDLGRRSVKAIRRIDEIDDASKAVNAGISLASKLGLIGNDNEVQMKLEQWLGSPVAQKLTLRFGKKTTPSSDDDMPGNGAVDTSSSAYDALTDKHDQEDADRQENDG